MHKIITLIISLTVIISNLSATEKHDTPSQTRPYAQITNLTHLEAAILSCMTPEVHISLEQLCSQVQKKGLSYSRDQVKEACSALTSKGRLIKHGHGRATTYTLASSSDSKLEQAFAQLHPETVLEQAIISSSEWIEGARWGEPRPGHPEGAVVHHVLEVLANVDALYKDSPFREKLRLIAMIHDTFKHKVDRSLPKSGENHHAMIARRFAEKFIQDEVVLDVIQKHDDAYNAWAKGGKYGDWDKAYSRARELIEHLGPNLPLYIAFYECDSQTGDKNQEPFLWFKNLSSQH